ncbi:MAG: FAD-binding protein [Anaerolineae bacterium]|nr:FAD-binding protein [Anaerolineae bacterium]
MYAPIDEQILDALRAIVGAEHVLTGREALEPYSHDETPELAAYPEVLVRPDGAEQISAILRLANARHVPVTPRGGGQGLSGGAVAVQGGILLSTERMNRILEIDHRNLMVTVEPAVVTGEIHRAVEAEDLFYPPDPASQDSCTIGGNVAESAGGPRAVKYGTTKDYVMGLEAVLPTGEIIHMGGKLVKDVAGYNIMQLMIGSEGTLGIVTQIILRLLPLPKAQIDLLVPFDDFQKAADAVAAIISDSLVPTTIEFMEREAVQASERLLGKEVPYSDAAAHLLISLTGQRAEDLEADLDEVGELCLDHGALDVLVAQDRPTRERLWEARRMILEALNHASPINHTEDVSVPRSEIPALLHGIRELNESLPVTAICFGHAGDGNVHVTYMAYDLPHDEWLRGLAEAQRQLYALTLSLGGTITGEHGVGATRREYLTQALGEPTVALLRRIKAAFDPNGILNPGKILP